MAKRWIIGLASGSTADRVEAALLELEGVALNLQVRLVQFLRQPYASDLRTLLRRVSRAALIDSRQLTVLHRLLGETLAAAARQVADRASMSLQRVQCLGCPGQLIWHEPEGRFPSLLTLGMPAVLAERTGITTVSDFMSRDVAAGGQGIPIDALGDYLLFRDVCETRVLIHLGGGARVVYLPAGGSPQSVLGFDAGPCNNLLDGLIQQLTGGQEEFDPGGKHAVQGRCMEVLLKRWLAHPFVQRRPPKSLRGQSCAEEIIAQAAQFSQDPALPIYDLLCTATHFVVHVITQSMRRFLPANSPPNRVLLSGGGIRNGLLWRLLEQHLVGIPMEKTDRFGAPAEARKAIGSGILAALTIDGVPGNVPSATGAAGARLLGSLTPGSSANWARCLTWMANQTAPLAVALD